MNKPVVTLDEGETNVRISWEKPVANEGQIENYRISFRKSDSSYVEIPEYCNGDNSNVESCDVPMEVLVDLLVL